MRCTAILFLSLSLDILYKSCFVCYRREQPIFFPLTLHSAAAGYFIGLYNGGQPRVLPAVATSAQVTQPDLFHILGVLAYIQRASRAERPPTSHYANVLIFVYKIIIGRIGPLFIYLTPRNHTKLQVQIYRCV